jgi:hypothetical protein
MRCVMEKGEASDAQSQLLKLVLRLLVEGRCPSVESDLHSPPPLGRSRCRAADALAMDACNTSAS